MIRTWRWSSSCKTKCCISWSQSKHSYQACKQIPAYVFHTHVHTHHQHHPPTPPPKLAIILNPPPAWVIPDNPRLILVNAGHSSAGFHPETTATGWGLVGSWRPRVGVLADGRNWSGSYRESRKTSTGFDHLQASSGLTPSFSSHSLVSLLSRRWWQNMFFTQNVVVPFTLTQDCVEIPRE